MDVIRVALVCCEMPCASGPDLVHVIAASGSRQA